MSEVPTPYDFGMQLRKGPDKDLDGYHYSWVRHGIEAERKRADKDPMGTRQSAYRHAALIAETCHPDLLPHQVAEQIRLQTKPPEASDA